MKIHLLSLILLAAPALYAVDGEVLINQSTVSSAGGFPYHIAHSGSYKLSGNLVSTLNETAIEIDSSDVLLDLNGFNVKCSFNGSVIFGSCINTAGQALLSITIRNGSVTPTATASTNFGDQVTGINLEASQSSTLEDLHFDSVVTNYSANAIISGPYSIIRHNTFNNAGPTFSCPSLVDGNVNQTPNAGSVGGGCTYVNNVGLFPQ